MLIVDQNLNHQVPIDNSNEESVAPAKAAMETGKKLLEKQQKQLAQLVRLLKQIESKVNSRRNHLDQTLSDHRVYLHDFFRRAIAELSSTFHSPRHSHHTFDIALKLLVATFKIVAGVLGSVESGVDELMHQLAEQMCDPMVEYVKGLMDDMKSGTCVRLLALVKEMERVMGDGRLQLEEAKSKERVAEETKIEALNRLTESQQRVNKMKECLLSLAQAQAQHNKGSIESGAVPGHKVIVSWKD